MKIFTYILLLFFYSCSVMEKGYVNEFNEYVPKKERYKYKDKKPIYTNTKIDTNSVYKLIESSDSIYEWHKGDKYLKFYSNGRLMVITKSLYDSLGNSLPLDSTDFIPIKKPKKYYYFYSNNCFTTENFVYATGYGMYIYFDYCISNDGKYINLVSDKSKETYIKQELDSTMKIRRVNW